MSKLAVTVEKVSDVKPHPNADRLDLVTVLGWQCVAQKGRIKAGDLVVYIPIDSVLPDLLLNLIFGPDAKVKPSGNRIRTIKLRGAISQGLVLLPSDIQLSEVYIVEGKDLTEDLGITKWEPPVTKNACSNMKPTAKKNQNENFSRYTDIEHLKKYPTALDGLDVIVTEKIHGTNFRAGWVPRPARSWWERLREKLGFWNDQWEFCWGSHNVQLQRKGGSKSTFHQETAKADVYTEAVKKYDLKNVLPKGVVVYGEIYGDGIQTNYSYGCKAGERRAVFFDVKLFGNYAHPQAAFNMFRQFVLPIPPVFYEGPFSMEKMELMVSGASTLAPSQKIMEGIVVKPVTEHTGYMGRMAFKFLNPDYLLLKDNTENH